ncbi:hypothetical protein OIV19_20450 [Brucella sp. HL-2]|nr:hypothetical protein [Brucella sp. HL-2]MCV9909973.1 hypothetical protein [Brucella sp. HL-2]
MAIPAGFEPATYGLEGCRILFKINVSSNFSLAVHASECGTVGTFSAMHYPAPSALAGGIMTPDQLQDRLTDIGWTPEILRHQLRCAKTLVDTWLTGKRPVPPQAGAWLSALAACHRAAENGKPHSLNEKKFVEPS